MNSSDRNRRPRIAVLGCGTVGREAVAQLLARRGYEVVRVLVRDVSRDRAIPPALFTDRFEDVLAAGPDLIVELLGGREPARAHVAAALRRGIPVVTANKTLVAHYGPDLAALARRRGAALAYEASVCAAVPVLGAVRRLRGDRIASIRGIVNGSCNYILTRMSRAGLPFDRALAEARDRGLVEPDPSADLSGRDSAEKLTILARAAGWRLRSPGDVECVGIDGITPGDIDAARRARCVIRLVAEVDGPRDHPRARVGPALVPLTNPLARTEGEQNAVVVTAELAGDLLLQGAGAGARATSSALLSDVARLLRTRRGVPVPARSAADRRHFLRIDASRLHPSAVLAAARAHAVDAEVIELSRSGAHVLLAAAPLRRSAAFGAGIGDGSGAILPVLA